MTHQHPPTTILAVVAEHGGEAVRQRAVELAREAGAGVILWDADAGTRLLEDPLPNQWSAEGEEEQFGDRLDVSDLEAAGRAPLARQVAEVRSAGVDAWGWLPSEQDTDELRDYAVRHGVEVVLVPADNDLAEELGDGLGDGLRVELV